MALTILEEDCSSVSSNTLDKENNCCTIHAEILDAMSNKTIRCIKFIIDEISEDLTVQGFIDMIRESETNLFDINNFLLSYKVYIKESVNNDFLFKLIDNRLSILNDLVSSENNTGLEFCNNIYLLPTAGFKTSIPQNNGILLVNKVPRERASSITDNSIDNNGKVSMVGIEGTPTINNINKTITPNITVLVVEDNPINCKILSKILKKHKIKYKLAKNGLEAIKMYSLRRH